MLDTFTLQEIKKDMRMYMCWKSTDITENQKKKRRNRKTSMNQITYIYIHTRTQGFFFNNNETINTTTTSI